MTDAATLPPKPRLAAIAPWFGGKRTLAPKIVEELGPLVGQSEPIASPLAGGLFTEASA